MENLPGVAAVLAPFLMVIGIVWVRSKAKIEEKRIAFQASRGDERPAAESRQIAEMEERIRVLERIVTDKGYDVASQIEALRDTQRVEQLLENRTEKETN